MSYETASLNLHSHCSRSCIVNLNPRQFFKFLFTLRDRQTTDIIAPVKDIQTVPAYSEIYASVDNLTFIIIILKVNAKIMLITTITA